MKLQFVTLLMLLIVVPTVFAQAAPTPHGHRILHHRSHHIHHGRHALVKHHRRRK